MQLNKDLWKCFQQNGIDKLGYVVKSIVFQQKKCNGNVLYISSNYYSKLPKVDTSEFKISNQLVALLQTKAVFPLEGVIYYSPVTRALK